MNSFPSAPKSTAVCPRPGRPPNAAAGADVTAQYRKGAEAALALYRLCGCQAALLKANSPSCGSGTIYDGSFSHVKISGDGVTAELLKANGIPVYTEQDCAALFE